MIRTLLALNGALIRGALAFVLTTQDDIEVVAEVDRAEDIGTALRMQRPDVAIADVKLFGAGALSNGAAPSEPPPVLVLVDPRRPRVLGDALRAQCQRLGFLGSDVGPERVIEAVRRLACGGSVVDADLVVAALARDNPLTEREVEVLEIAAEGWPVVEIASKLSLSAGTVRNHLSRIAGKTGARTRIEAIRIARERGWI
ncbi:MULTISPECIES: response regulator transcription factor [unclassified Plantactinospora]|uniref:response regulator transcription factor n=1 Tax=unclassified Plantactinospora TaxID=2631981 RepID=UPI000D167F3B|nr:MULTISPECIES: response regulator transcription factor [unclassified Plantactinospora]AVT28904.1 DNA-binding response regulator [Plantactinospora sp. BC1]AVT35305.1 DNA-binding response regulator [Plantactinospora sp. BB1]